MNYLLVAWLPVVLYLFYTPRSSGISGCKCLYGQPCWPSSQAINALSAELSQPLIYPRPPAAPCYSSSSEDPALCSEVQSKSRSGIWRSTQPGAYQNLNFEFQLFANDTLSACYLNHASGSGQRTSCGQGAIPPVGVDARRPEDVQAAVRFASQYNLKLVVKNTGHDYMGRSAGSDGFMIWTHHMKDIEFHDAFTAQGAPSHSGEKVVTLGAGVQWSEAYAAVANQGRYIVGGVSLDGSTGAAGGWLLGGGHNFLSGKFGLGVDNVLEMTLVNAQGEHITVNEYTNPTLWWALRGGGGGTFGVITSVTYRTHPLIPLTSAFGFVNFSTPANAQRGITSFIRAHAALSDDNWGGYSLFTNTTLIFAYFAPDASLEDAEQTISPLFEDLRAVGIGPVSGPPILQLNSIDSFWTIGQSLLGVLPVELVLSTSSAISGVDQAGGQSGVSVEASSRLLSRDAALHRAEDVARTLLSLDFAAMNYVGGGQVNNVDPDAMALHPAWRNALAQVFITEPWDDGASVETLRAVQKRIRDNTLVLDEISTDSAAYMNEATTQEVDYRKSFWGSHYPKLKEIKDQVDPAGLFVVPFGVGSEDWDFESMCRV